MTDWKRFHRRGLSATHADDMADMFRSAGYATAHPAKWHLGSGAGGHKPFDKGFRLFVRFSWARLHRQLHAFLLWAGPDRHDL